MISFFKKMYVPKGLYCYKPIKIEYIQNNIPVMKVKNCPFYNYKHDIIGFCNLLNCEIYDSLKDCGIKEGWKQLEKEWKKFEKNK